MIARVNGTLQLETNQCEIYVLKYSIKMTSIIMNINISWPTKLFFNTFMVAASSGGTRTSQLWEDKVCVPPLHYRSWLMNSMAYNRLNDRIFKFWHYFKVIMFKTSIGLTIWYNKIKTGKETRISVICTVIPFQYELSQLKEKCNWQNHKIYCTTWSQNLMTPYFVKREPAWSKSMWK